MEVNYVKKNTVPSSSEMQIKYTLLPAIIRKKQIKDEIVNCNTPCVHMVGPSHPVCKEFCR